MSSTSQKHKTFVADPIKDKPIKELPGIGEVYAKRLENCGFTKAFHVLGQFLVLDKSRELFVDWLVEAAEMKSTKFAEQCYNGLYEWTEQFI